MVTYEIFFIFGILAVINSDMITTISNSLGFELPSNLIPFATYNPFGHLIDSFNFMFVGAGSFDWVNIGYSAICAVIILFTGVLIFNQVEKNFMDTV